MHLHHSNLRSTLSTTASSCVRPETSTPLPACQHSTTASEPKLKPLAVDLKLLAVALPPSAAAGPAVVAGFERRVPAWPKVPEDPTSRPALLDCARSCCKAASRAAATLLHSRFDKANVSIPGAAQRCKVNPRCNTKVQRSRVAWVQPLSYAGGGQHGAFQTMLAGCFASLHQVLIMSEQTQKQVVPSKRDDAPT